MRYAVLAFFTLAFAIYILKKAVKQFYSAQVTREQAKADREVATFLTRNADIRRMVVSKLSVRDVIRFSIVEKDWRAILQERTGEPEESKVKDWYFPLWFQNLHPDMAIDRDPTPNLTFPLLPTRRYTTLRWHGVHHDNTFQTDDHSLPFLDFLWDVPGNPPLGFIFAATAGGLLLFYKFIYLPKRSTSSITGDGPMEIFALLTVCNPFTKQSRDLPYPFYEHYREIGNFCDFHEDDMHLVVDDPTSNAYSVLMVTREFVKEWNSVSNEWTTSRLDNIDNFLALSSLSYQGCLYVLEKRGSVLAVTLLKRNEWGTWVVDNDLNKHFAIVYKGGEMSREHFGTTTLDVDSNLHLVGCNGLLFAVMVTEEADSLTRDTSLVRRLVFHVFELPEGCRSFVRVARIPASYFTEMSSEYTYERDDGQWYQGWWLEKFCCTAKGKEIWIACQGYLLCYDVVTGGWRKEGCQHTNNFVDSISTMPFEPSFTAKP